VNSSRLASLGLWSLSLAYFSMGTASIAVVGLIHAMSASLDVSKPAIAGLVTVFALTFAVAAPLLQVVAGRLSRRTLLLVGLHTMAAGCLATAWAPSYDWMIAARVLTALGGCAVGPVASSLGAGLVPVERQGHALAVVFSGMTFATVFGLPMATWLGALVGWRWTFVCLAALIVAIAFTIQSLVSDRRPAPAVTLASFLQVFRRGAPAWAVATAGCFMAAQFCVYALVAPFLEQRFGVAPDQLSLAFLLAGLSSVIGNLLAGRFGDRLGASRTLAGVIIGLAAVFLLVLTLPGRPWIGMAAFAVWSMVGMAFYAPQQKRLVGLAPDLRNLLLAMNSSSLYIGMSLGAAASSHAWRTLGPWSLPLASAAFLALALTTFALSRRAELRDARASLSA
jgi:DHA1 family inner membrane transport protein